MCEMNYSSFLDGLIPKRLQLNLLITCSAALLGNTAEHVISKLSCNLLGIKPSKKDE